MVWKKVCLIVVLSAVMVIANAFSPSRPFPWTTTTTRLYSDKNWNENTGDQWENESAPDWQDDAKKQSGEFWTTFESSDKRAGAKNKRSQDAEQDDTDAWLNTLASLSAEEDEFQEEADDDV